MLQISEKNILGVLQYYSCLNSQGGAPTQALGGPQALSLPAPFKLRFYRKKV